MHVEHRASSQEGCCRGSHFVAVCCHGVVSYSFGTYSMERSREGRHDVCMYICCNNERRALCISSTAFTL